MITILSLIFGGGRTTKFTIIALFAVLISLATFTGIKMFENASLTSKVSTLSAKNAALTTDNLQLQANITTLHENQKTLMEVNEANQLAISNLQFEREQSKAALAKLSVTTKKNKQDLDKLQQIINDMKADPANDGTVSPVLKETIKQIQSMEQDK